MINRRNNRVVCFGEVLWDMLPAGKQPGGAPMNVAYHLCQLGIDSALISRVGCDADGEELQAFLYRMGIPTSFVQKDGMYPTSKVLVALDGDSEVNYDIVAPVAWDAIEYEDRFDDLIDSADVFVYGSLAGRHTASRETLLRLLDKSNRYRLFDINLRAPHYTPETVDTLLQRADAIKLNFRELIEVSAWLGNHSGQEHRGVELLQERYDLQEIIVTKGAKGASYYTPTSQYNCPAVPVEVRDTVGSGDAFLAAFIAQKLKGADMEHILGFATAMGAYVATQPGACPSYSAASFNRFMLESCPYGVLFKK